MSDECQVDGSLAAERLASSPAVLIDSLANTTDAGASECDSASATLMQPRCCREESENSS